MLIATNISGIFYPISRGVIQHYAPLSSEQKGRNWRVLAEAAIVIMAMILHH
jgi:hypothetical protein